MEITVQPVEAAAAKAKPNVEDLGFGRYFTDYMFQLNYAPERGWHEARVVPYAPLALDPACMALHYGQQIFEGIKAFQGVDGTLRIFRPRSYLARMQRSATRMCMPDIPTELLLEGIKRLLWVDRAWAPAREGCALYIRPNLIAADPYLGVRPSETYLLYVIVSPVGAYYPQGFNPVSILVEDRYVRAVAGGAGEAKTGGNYAATLVSQVEAKRLGFTQVLWLDGKERRYVEEVGTMNIFFLIDDELVTSPLAGSVLAGITRDSVLHLARRWGQYRVTERPLSIDEAIAAAQSGRLREVFGTGTAAVISPVGQFRYKEQTYTVADGQTGALAQRLYRHILDLQYARQPDPDGWLEPVTAQGPDTK